MFVLKKRLHIAIIGLPSSGKSYLLFDMIHAFSHLGYEVNELPLSYPHSSFGTFFYDTINPMTGGIKGTETYACRPENHYGAYYSLKRNPFRSIAVDFLNIPGEAFKERDTINRFFTLKNSLERTGEGVFWLSIWKSPSKHVIRVIVPNEEFKIDSASNDPVNPYKSWSDLKEMLEEGSYEEQGKRCSVSGKYVLRHISELSTDSVLLTLRSNWSQILVEKNENDYEDYNGSGVFKYFYFFAYCQLATDLVICDRLSETRNVGQLAEDVCHFMNIAGKHIPQVYLAFRGIDTYLQTAKRRISHKTIIQKNEIYGHILTEIISQLQGKEKMQSLVTLPQDVRKHIAQSCGVGIGHAFWQLLNTSTTKSALWIYYIKKRFCGQKTARELSDMPGNVLPPHVYFTATPIDDEFCIYKNDKDDITRFIYEEHKKKKSFLQETCVDMSRHLCFGSLQLLIDILLQNNIHIRKNIKDSFSAELLYAQTKLIK